MSPLARKVALVVEDLPSLRQRMTDDLTREGMRVEAVPNYHVAASRLASLIPDIVIASLTLPRESGFELCELVRRSPAVAWVPILAMDERSSPAEMAYAEEVGANAFLRKPFTRAELVEYVAAMIGGPAVSRPNGVRFLFRDVPRRAP